MTFPNVNFETLESQLHSFDHIANKISKDIKIKVNEACYRIVDFEFYTYSKAIPDPHTYKNELQLETGKLYIHGSGVDLTFGDGINYGGILLRSIVKLFDGADKDHGFMKKQFDGPQIVATELFANLHPLNSSEKNEIAIVDIQGHNQDSCFHPAKAVIKTKRVGLTPKSIDSNDFYKNLELRYVMILPRFPKFKQAIKGIESLLGEQIIKGKMTIEDARGIIGYNAKFL